MYSKFVMDNFQILCVIILVSSYTSEANLLINNHTSNIEASKIVYVKENSTSLQINNNENNTVVENTNDDMRNRSGNVSKNDIVEEIEIISLKSIELDKHSNASTEISSEKNITTINEDTKQTLKTLVKGNLGNKSSTNQNAPKMKKSSKLKKILMYTPTTRDLYKIKEYFRPQNGLVKTQNYRKLKKNKDSSREGRGLNPNEIIKKRSLVLSALRCIRGEKCTFAKKYARLLTDAGPTLLLYGYCPYRMCSWEDEKKAKELLVKISQLYPVVFKYTYNVVKQKMQFQNQ